MTISSSATNRTGYLPDRARMFGILRWSCVIPAYIIALVGTFFATWVLSMPFIGDDGLSWFCIVMVLSATFAAVGASGLVAPKHKLIVALLFALVTVSLVPHPYTSQSSCDGESIPSAYALGGVVLGSFLALAFVFFGPRRIKNNPSS
jgi:hypothetical protein